MLSPLPRRSGWASCFARFTQPCQPSPIWRSGRPAHCPFRGLLGVHSRYGLHTRAVTVYRDPLTEGFSHFVTSIAAPVASGWSARRVGGETTGKRRLSTAHGHSGTTVRPRQGRPTGLLPSAIFSGLVSSPCALANAAAMVPIAELDGAGPRCATDLWRNSRQLLHLTTRPPGRIES